MKMKFTETLLNPQFALISIPSGWNIIRDGKQTKLN